MCRRGMWWRYPRRLGVATRNPTDYLRNNVGKSIVSRQEGATWGKSVVEQLAKNLQAEFPGTAGFSVRNIWNMRNFYLAYHQNEKLQPMVAEIG
jgi:hypothetical protein